MLKDDNNQPFEDETAAQAQQASKEDAAENTASEKEALDPNLEPGEVTPEGSEAPLTDAAEGPADDTAASSAEKAEDKAGPEAAPNQSQATVPGTNQPDEKELADLAAEKKPGKSKKKRLLIGLVAVILLVCASAGIYVANRYASGNIEGTWGSKQIEDDIRTAYTEATKDASQLSEKVDYLTGRDVNIKVSDDKVEGKVTLTFDREAYYQAYLENAKQIKDRLAAISEQLSQYDSTYNFFARMKDFPTSSKEDVFEIFDEYVAEITPKGAKYNAESGKLTVPLFSGTVNRYDHTIKIRSVTQSETFGLGKLPLKKGSTVHFTKTKQAVRITDSKKKAKLVWNK